MATAFKPCSVDGCNRNAHARGWCITHYQRWRTKGGVSDELMSDGRHKLTRWLEAHKQYEGEGCLSWPFSRGDHGRGVALLDGVLTSAPKVMCTLAHGPAPSPDHQAAHSCGKGHEGCIHPQHLSWKTAVENEADKIVHDTIVRGTDVNTNKLTEEQVREIRRIGTSLKRGVVARMFGVSVWTIWEIRTRRSWAWLA